MMENTPLLGREQEYNDVLRFIEERLLIQHCKSLFVFGACGSGKTSTIIRAMRRVTHRVMTYDKAAGRSSTGSNSSNGGGGLSDSPPPAAGRKQQKQMERQRPTKRQRGSETEGNAAGAAAVSADNVKDGHFRSIGNAATPGDPTVLFPHLFGKGRRVQCHYVNCADMTAQQLCDSISETFCSSQVRLDAQTRTLVNAVGGIPKRVSAMRRRSRELLKHYDQQPIEEGLPTAGLTKTTVKTPLHVLVLDEVEYVRAAARGALASLAELSAEYASQLALVFISNQREFVHVPHMLLKELPFEAYSAEMLESIGNHIVAAAHFTRKEKEQVQLSPGLIRYIARKALVEFSGDVRQVAVMCRRLIHTAVEEQKKSVPPKGRVSTEGGETPRGSRELAGATAPGGNSPGVPAALITLAQSQKILRGPDSVGDRVFEYVSAMPEQMLYVLSCLVVLMLRQQRDSQIAKVSIGSTSAVGRRQNKTAIGSSFGSYSAAEPGPVVPGTFTTRVVHRLYTALMGQQRFPSMNAAGISSAIDGFADIGIISRPQRRGNEEVFSFNGTWTLESMQAALTARGEALRQERVDCGLDSAENRFEEVLRELKGILSL
ncbi:hypothetical protein, conserved [Trypanosoma brucei brucei TREU927]|uniref:AAA+ ATPase domain-containing protein n=1 Tax=Trypanosoma brucei brucei (strain 927/4 GUTat10.1) TaxID=185431 RepID=Q38FV5_TRYB2|nr:hypothetical protein, conserved [Trypanosoma brucei brucei TREU927]EAN76315.1 hypothetical protein, conserved [Trypanosoma brucei brucei TREU927]